MNIEETSTLLLTAAGVAAFISLLVNVGKQINIVKDGHAPQWVRALNLIVFVGFWIVGNYFPDVSLWEFDATVGVIADVGWSVLALLIPGGVWVGENVHSKIKGLPVLGKSNSE